jgi:hypothetical protein
VEQVQRLLQTVLEEQMQEPMQILICNSKASL